MLALFDAKQNQEMFANSEREEGENKMALLMQLLFAANRNEDAVRAASDAEYRAHLYKEFAI